MRQSFLWLAGDQGVLYIWVKVSWDRLQLSRSSNEGERCRKWMDGWHFRWKQQHTCICDCQAFMNLHLKLNSCWDAPLYCSVKQEHHILLIVIFTDKASHFRPCRRPATLWLTTLRTWCLLMTPHLMRGSLPEGVSYPGPGKKLTFWTMRNSKLTGILNMSTKIQRTTYYHHPFMWSEIRGRSCDFHLILSSRVVCKLRCEIF